jgi:hypothetical protein
LGLLNVTNSHLPIVSPIVSTDSLPLEDDQIKAKPLNVLTGNDWNRSSPTSSGKKSAVATIDLVARERASKSHYMLEKLLADAARRNGLMPKYNTNVDMYFETPHGMVLAEAKSCTDNNFHSQVRKGISQLFEYRFLHKFDSQSTMLLVTENVPPQQKKWLVDYAFSLGIVLAWKESHTQKIVSTCALPKALFNIVTRSRQ